MTYPTVIDEWETVQKIIEGASIARYGDGELKLILGRDCVSQRASEQLGRELQHILRTESVHCLTGIMNLNQPSPKEHWTKYQQSKFTRLLNPAKQYHSSFITRPDSVPWINTVEYWAHVTDIWTNRDITLVTGGRSSALRPETMLGVGKVTIIEAPQEHAYAEIDRIERDVLSIKDDSLVILCLGPTATCLAWRLAHQGKQALDLGHIGMFFRKFLKGEKIGGFPKD